MLIAGKTLGTNGAFGNNVQVAVLDWSAYLQKRDIQHDDDGDITTVNLGGIHEEFVDARDGDLENLRVLIEGTDTGHPGLELIFDENMPYEYSADFGTAVLGVIGANWNPAAPLPGTAGYPPNLTTRLNNNVGVLGLAPDATLIFFPLATVNAPDREQDAWLNAIETLNPGDVICAAYAPVATNPDQPNLNYWLDTAVYLQLARNKSICTVIRAGNTGINLSELEFPLGDQFAIVATAVTPGSIEQDFPNSTGFKRYCDSLESSSFAQATPPVDSLDCKRFGLG